MVTIGAFAKTHKLHPKEVIDLAQTLSLSFTKPYAALTEHDALSDEASAALIKSLNQHLKGVGLNKLKEVSTVVTNNGRQTVTVLTKKKTVKAFDLEALKNKAKEKQDQEEKETQHVATTALINEQPEVLEEFLARDLVLIPSVEEEPINPAVIVEEPAAGLALSKNKETKTVILDDEDAPKNAKIAPKSKSAKKKKTGANQPLEIAKIDNQALKKITAQFQYRDSDEDFAENLGGNRRKKDKEKKNQHQFNKPVKKVELIVKLGESISVADLADQMSMKIVIVLKELLKMGVVAQAQTILDKDTATLVVQELGHQVADAQEENPELSLQRNYVGAPEVRNPVVTIMGHVDHGKTSLLDYIRRARVAASEAGGITQHIGAYKVKTQHGDVTFLDTPGHAAFTAMRARGTQCTDIAVILVAADDGVMPQTKEAISHAKAAGVPIVVAINKVDKPGCDLERVKTELSLLDVLPEEWGGDSPFMPVSAKTGQGVEAFLEVLALQAEILELKAHRQGPAVGTVIESSLSKHQGPVTTVLVQEGTLAVGDLVVSGVSHGKIRALFDDLGRSVQTAGPSTPVQIVGLSSVVDAGEPFIVVAQEKQAKDIVDYRLKKMKQTQNAAHQGVNLENFFAQSDKKKELNLIVKADTHGSVQAIVHSLQQLNTAEVQIKVIAQAVGGISDSDIMLAKASSAIILAFNTRAEKTAKILADQDKIAIYYFSIIYELLDHVRSAIYGLESPKFKQTFVGLAEVRSVFRSSVLGNIAGCLVVDGSVRKDLPIRVLRKNIVVFEGKLESLRRFKDDVQEVRAGTECGIGVKDYNDIQEGDQIEVYRMVEVLRKPD